MDYKIVLLHADYTPAVAPEYARTLRAARSIAWSLARRHRPYGCTARPVWCGADAWDDHPRRGEAVGGYDGTAAGCAAAVVYHVTEV